MKRLPRSPWFACIALFSVVIFSACATAPAPEPGFVPGTYKNEELRFTVKYPETYKVQPLQVKGEVFRAAKPTMWKLPVFTVNIVDASADAKLDSGAFIKGVQEDNPGSKRFTVLSETAVTLNDATPGLLMTYKWTWTDGNTKLQTASLWTVKSGKSITISATTVLGGDTTPDKLVEMVNQLEFY